MRRPASQDCLVLALALCGAVPALAADAPPAGAACQQRADSWSSSGPWDTRKYGNYFLSNDNFNNTPGQKLWANSESCWGVVTSATVERNGVGSYPHVVRGWSQMEGDMREHSSPGSFDWTRKSGLGIPVDQLKKALVHWSFSAPTGAGARWLALIDVYFHRSDEPDPKQFPPQVDLMIDQALMDQPLGAAHGNVSTYYGSVMSESHPFEVTLGGNKYAGYVDSPGESAYHRPGGHTIHLFQLPTSYTGGTTVNWGAMSATTDLGAIVRHFAQAAPKDDKGQPLQDATGRTLSVPLFAADLYLNAINAGWEIDVGTAFRTDDFWIALQDEPNGR